MYLIRYGKARPFLLGSAFGSLPPGLDGTCTEPYRGLPKLRFAPSTRRTREAVAARSGTLTARQRSDCLHGRVKTAAADPVVGGDCIAVAAGRRDGSTLVRLEVPCRDYSAWGSASRSSPCTRAFQPSQDQNSESSIRTTWRGSGLRFSSGLLTSPLCAPPNSWSSTARSRSFAPSILGCSA